MLNLQKINALDPGRYDLTIMETFQLAKLDKFDAVYLAYKYGFFRGQNSIRNQSKKKAPASAATTSQGAPNPNSQI